MTKSTFALFAALALVACKGDDSDTVVDTDPVGNCTISFDAGASVPANGATNVYYRSTLEFAFSDPDTSATVEITSGGTAVAGTSTWVEDVLVFEPTNPLSPSTTYDWTVTFCDGDNSSTGSFTTSAVGAAVDEAGLVGTTYVLDLASGRFVEPPNVGALLQEALTVDILIGVASATGANIEMLGAIAVEGSNPPTQDDCVQTIDFPTATFSANPFFEVGPENTTITVSGISVTIDDLFVSGAFAPDGSAIAGAVLAGQVDTRPLGGLIDSTDENAICELVVQFGVACETCSGGGDFCLSLYVDSIAASEVNGEVLVPITEAEAEANCPAPAN